MNISGLEDGSIHKKLDLQVWGSEFNPTVHIKKISVMMNTCNPRAEVMETGRFLELTDQLVEPSLSI